HFDHWSLARRRLDLTGAGSAAEVLRLVAERLTGGEPADPVLVGYGFRDGTWPDRPSRAALDLVAAELPVVLSSNDLHSCWLNSAAFRRFGVAPTDDGLLREDAAMAVHNALDKGSDERLDRWAGEAAEAAAARGVVGIVELEWQFNPEIWARRVAAGVRSLRVECGFYPEHLDTALGLGLRTGDRLPDGDGLLTLGPLKLFLDGSLNTRTAYCHRPYPEPGDPDHDHGMLLLEPPELITQLRRTAAAGLECAVHAIGDRANTIALDGFEAARCGGRIEHAQLIRAEDVDRFARLGVVASVQPDHAVVDRDVADRHWPDRTDRAFPYADLLRSGATLRLGSDAPVSPLDPWQTIAAAVHRSADDRPSWHPEQEITARQALDASTRQGAAVRPGDPADLVITELDPLSASAEELRAMPVHGTMVAGRWTRRPDDLD
ncbi:MAG TPA: amidohydrolase family protein, partial [Microlunatus sp.]|nr:amidohydrolase family protein [Microlunatus sp.]